MAKKKSQNRPDQRADNPDKELPVDETIRMDGEDSKPDIGDSDVPGLMETTVGDMGDVDLPGHSTIIFNPNATVAVGSNSTILPDDSEADPEASVKLESTMIDVDLDGSQGDDHSGDPSGKKVTDTVDLSVNDGPPGKGAGVAVFPGKGSQGKSDEKDASSAMASDSIGETKTLDGLGESTEGSLMVSAEIGRTVNPRDLSKKDAEDWDAIVGAAHGDSSVLSPAIDRTFSDMQLERLRKCDVAPLKSDPEKASDYRLVRKLGQGGMGDVFVARQGSLDRLLALKLLKPLPEKKRIQLSKAGKLDAFKEERRQQFLSEAIVTGDLDHPNIVPIHDVGVTSKNEIFYSMKRVLGTPWSDVIHEKSRDENLEILLKACDAVGFAHTRGVVHRDIKPENIMLGDFGVVMVMDWGLALPTSGYDKPSSMFATSGLGGTPAFMAPEMATGPLDKIGPASDIYLFGATLFMIVTGKAPHQAKNITECLRAVRLNKIRQVDEAHRGELFDIALKAMATDVKDRYQDIASFQAAIREYRSHSESISLAARAFGDLSQGRENQTYADFSRAAFRFEESVKSWDGNRKAHDGLAQTKVAHAEAAYGKGDFDFGLSLLDEENPEHASLITKLREGLKERELRTSRLALMKKVAVAMLAFILIGGSGAMFLIYRSKIAAEKSEGRALIAKAVAEEQTQIAVVKTKEAKEQEAKAKEQEAKAKKNEKAARDAEAIARAAEKAAETERKAALESAEQERLAKLETEKALDATRIAKDNEVEARRLAEQERQEAIDARKVATAQRERALYEEYVSKIGLAKARLERNEADGARQILRQLQENSPKSVESWEWQWLWRQANQSESSKQAADSVIDLSLSPSGRTGAVALSNGSVKRLTLDQSGRLIKVEQIDDPRLSGIRASSVAISPQGNLIAIGTQSGDIVLLSGPQKLRGHIARVNDLQFTNDGVLVSGSQDKTVRAWDPKTGRELTDEKACWHISPVRQVAVRGSRGQIQVVAGVADDSNGQVVLWNLRRSNDSLDVKRVGTFAKHQRPVSAVAISDDGRLVASGDLGGNLLIWSPSSTSKIDYAGSIKDALSRVKDSQLRRTSKSQTTRFARLLDSSPVSERRLVSTISPTARESVAHDDVVKSIRFSSDGKSLLSSSDDHTLKVWDVNSRKLGKTFKGHGGWVVGAEFLKGETDVIVSASNDASIRSWRTGKYVGAYLIEQLGGESEKESPMRNAKAHDNEIWSASFSPDGSKVVTASRDHTARVMAIDKETLSFKEIARLDSELLDEGTSFVGLSIQVDRPHQRLYIGSADSTIRIWDLAIGTEIGRATRTGLNAAFAVSKDGNYMLTGSSMPKVKAILWKLDPTGTRSPQIVHRLKGHDQSVTAFAISQDSRQLFTGDRDGYGILWDAKTGGRVGEPIENVRGFRINAASFSKDNRELILGADDEQLTRIDLGSRQIVGRMNHDGFVNQISLSDDGHYCVTVSELTSEREYRSAATLWDLRTGLGQRLDRVSNVRKKDQSLRDRQRISSAQFATHGKTVVVAHAASSKRSGMIQVWDVDSVVGQRPRFLVGTPGSSSVAKVNPQQTLEMPRILGSSEVVLPLDDRRVLTLNKTAAFQWDLASTKLIKSYRAHAELTDSSFSFDGSFVATASRSVKIWDARTGKAIGKLESPHVGPVRSVHFAPRAIGATQYVFATGGDDGVARIWSWNPDSKQIIELRHYVVDGKEQAIQQVRFSPTQHQLLVVGNQGQARVWDLNQPRSPMLTLDSDDAEDFLCGDFSKDGTCVAAGGTDQKIRVWKLSDKDGAEAIVLEGHADSVNDLVFLGEKDSLRLMTASSDDTARVWDPRLSAKGVNGTHPGGREIVSLRRHTGDVTAVDVTNGGKLLMTAGRDGNVILWPASPAKTQEPAKSKNLFDALN